MDDLHRRVERGYDAIAERYDLVTRANRGPETYFRSFLDGVLARIPRDGRVLDLGCGGGSITYELTRRARVVGLDRSAVQLALARAAAPQAHLVRADIAEVAFRQGSFDAVVAFWTLIHVQSDRHRSVIADIHDWLRPGGVFAGTWARATASRTSRRTSSAPRCRGATSTPRPIEAPSRCRLRPRPGDEVRDESQKALWVIGTA